MEDREDNCTEGEGDGEGEEELMENREDNCTVVVLFAYF